MSECLIIFTKNLQLGKVKTRIAKTAGDQEALEIYQQLLSHTSLVCSELECHKVVYYSDFIPVENPYFPLDKFSSRLQVGGDLGERMSNAFIETLGSHQKVIIIGSDCIQITSNDIEDVYNKLDHFDYVIGPSTDGGYYLLGMKQLNEEIFQNIEWSTSEVFNNTLNIFKKLKKDFLVLKSYTDIDNEQDWLSQKHLIRKNRI